MTELTFHINPDARGVELTPELAAALGIKDGDHRFITQSPHGIVLTEQDIERAKTLELTKSFVERYKDALTELAK